MVLLADSHPALLEGIRGLLGAVFDSVVMVSDEESLMEALPRLDPDLVVVDQSLRVAQESNVITLLKKGSIRNSQQVKRPKSLIVFLFIIFSRACCEAKGEALRYSMHGNENVRNCILKH